MCLDLLMKAFSSPFSFYVLGAGASAGLVPRTCEMKDTVINRYLEYGSYPVTPANPDDVSRRIIGDPRSLEPRYKPVPLSHIYPSLVQAIVLKELVPKWTTHAHQYQIFSLVSKPSIVFNMNVDGLAERHCYGHIVLTPHGTVPAHIIVGEPWNMTIDSICEYGFDVPALPGEAFLPKPETTDITRRSAYQEAPAYFQFAPYLILVGYSFGRYNDSIDDSQTFSLLTDLLKTYPKPVLVIDPNPGRTAAMIQDSIRQREVYTLSMRWDYLTRAILEVSCKLGCANLTNMRAVLPSIQYAYDHLLGQPSSPRLR